MIAPILIAISWLLLRLEGKNLTALGFDAPKRRVIEFSAGFLVAGAIVVTQQFGLSFATNTPWQLNRSVNWSLLLNSVRWNVNSVLYEELLFRGYLLYQAIRWLGIRRGILLGAVAFGIYHWFSYGLIGHPVMMVFILLFTGAFGFMFALAFATTRSVAAPIGLHLGWNLVAYLGFSGGPLGPGILPPANGATRMQAAGFPDFMLEVVLPLILVLSVSLYLVRMSRRQEAKIATAAVTDAA